MKKTTTIICLCVLIAVFIFMFIFCMFFPRTTQSRFSISPAPEFSVENLFSGKYFTDLKNYFTDSIAYRDDFFDAEARIRELYGINDGGAVVIGSDEEPEEDNSEISDIESSVEDQVSQDISSPDNSETTSSEAEDNSDTENSVGSTSEESDENSEPDIYEPSQSEDESSTDTTSDTTIDKFHATELEGQLVLFGNRVFELYRGDRNDDIIRYAETLNQFADKMGSEVNVYSMIIPKSSAYYLQPSINANPELEKYSKYLNCNKDDIDKIAEHLSDKVTDVNIHNVLGQHANEYIYFRTDHHWTALGAYYASEKFASLAGLATDDIAEFTSVMKNGYLGSLYSQTGNAAALQNNPDSFEYYVPDTDYTVYYYNRADLTTNERVNENGFFWEKDSDLYGTFLSGDSYSIRAVSNECKNGRKLLMVKDSYGNALAPFLIEGFEEIYIVDARYYERSLSETVSEYGITDVLFTECTFSAADDGYVNNLKELCK